MRMAEPMRRQDTFNIQLKVAWVLLIISECPMMVMLPYVTAMKMAR